MFHVFKLDCEGNPNLLEVCIDKDRLNASIDLWSNTYPHAIIDYVQSDSYEASLS